jgi:hypothetical protein
VADLQAQRADGVVDDLALSAPKKMMSPLGAGALEIARSRVVQVLDDRTAGRRGPWPFVDLDPGQALGAVDATNSV